jgi:hypothetical protein
MGMTAVVSRFATSAVVALVAAALAGPAFADPSPPAPNPGEHGTNCVGRNSSAVTHNGTSVRDQAQQGVRSELVHADREAPVCGETPFPPGTGTEPNPGEHGTNCVGRNSSAVTHNGTVVSDQAQAGVRSDLVHADRDATTCGSTPSP